MKTKPLLLGMLALICLSTNAQWQTTNGPYSGGIVQSICTNGSHVFCGTHSGGAFLYNGTSWTPINSGLTGSPYDVTCITNKGTDIYCTEGYTGLGKVYLSTNNGSSWDSINTGLKNAQTVLVYGPYLFAGTDLGGTNAIFYSANNGSNWFSFIFGAPWPNNGVYGMMVDTTIDSILAIACVASGSQVTTDGGYIWTFNTFLGGGYSNCITRIGSNIFMGTSKGVYLTTDYGSTWSSVSSSMPGNNIIYSLAVNGTSLIAGSDSGVYVTYNNGNLWHSINTGLTDRSVHSLATDGSYLYAGTKTQGVWKRALSEISSGIYEIGRQAGINIYPNPGRDLFIIESETNISNIEIFNVVGERIYSHMVDSKNVKIDLSTKPKGIYFYHMISENGLSIKEGKIIIQ